MYTRKLAGVGVALMALLLVLAPMALAQEGTATPEATGTAPTGSVTVSDQEIVDGTVTVDSVTSSAAGWIVIHADQGGGAGPVIGFAPVQAGDNSNVVVEIDAALATDTLHAMLHTDAGTEGTYEFPGPDAPVTVDGEVVVEAFQVTGGLQVTPGVTTTATVTATVGATDVPTVAPTGAATTEVTATVAATSTVAGTPGSLPTTGGSPTPWALVLLALGGLILLGGAGLALARRS